MLKKNRKALAGLAVVGLLATGVGARTALARVGTHPLNGSAAIGQEQKNKNLVEGEKEAKKMLLLMDKDRNGKVSRDEFMSFMATEFDRLDKDKSGELDVRGLTQTPVHSSGPPHR